jgi:hypothetical protein
MPIQKKLTRQEMLESIADNHGIDLDDPESYEDIVFDSVQPCCCKYCGYVGEAEPDCVSGYCEECDSPTCVSFSVLLGII